MTDYLTPEELYELTRRVKHKAQLRQLAKQGIPAITDADGRPLVLRAVRDSIMAGSTTTAKQRANGPRWDKMPHGAASTKH